MAFASSIMSFKVEEGLETVKEETQEHSSTRLLSHQQPLACDTSVCSNMSNSRKIELTERKCLRASESISEIVISNNLIDSYEERLDKDSENNINYSDPEDDNSSTDDRADKFKCHFDPSNNALNEKRFYKIFVGGVGQGTKEETLVQYFSQYGNIIRCAVVTHKKSNKNRGFAFITYDSEESAQKAISAKHKIDNVIVECRKALTKNEIKSTTPVDSKKDPCKVFIGGIPDTAKEECIREFFSRFGEVVDVSLIYNKINHKPRGFGFVMYSTSQAAEHALGLHSLYGKMIEVKRAEPRDLMARNYTRKQTDPQQNLYSYDIENYHSYPLQPQDHTLLGMRQFGDNNCNDKDCFSWETSHFYPNHCEQYSLKLQQQLNSDNNDELKKKNIHASDSRDLIKLNTFNNYDFPYQSSLKAQSNNLNFNDSDWHGFVERSNDVNRATKILNNANGRNFSLPNGSHSVPYCVNQSAKLGTKSNTNRSNEDFSSPVYLQHPLVQQYYIKNQNENVLTQSSALTNLIQCTSQNSQYQLHNYNKDLLMPQHSSQPNVILGVSKQAGVGNFSTSNMSKSVDLNNGNSLACTAASSSIFSLNSPTTQGTNVPSNSLNFEQTANLKPDVNIKQDTRLQSNSTNCSSFTQKSNNNRMSTSTINNFESNTSVTQTTAKDHGCTEGKPGNLSITSNIAHSTETQTQGINQEIQNNLSQNQFLTENQNGSSIHSGTIQQDFKALCCFPSSVSGFTTAAQGKCMHPTCSALHPTTVNKAFEEQHQLPNLNFTQPTLFTNNLIQPQNTQEPVQVLLQRMCPSRTIQSVCSPTQPNLAKSSSSVVTMNNADSPTNDIASKGEKSSLAQVVHHHNPQQISSATQSPINTTIPSFIQTVTTHPSCQQLSSSWNVPYYAQPTTSAAAATPLYKQFGVSVAHTTTTGVSGSSAAMSTGLFPPMSFGNLSLSGQAPPPPPSQQSSSAMIQPISSSSFIVGDNNNSAVSVMRMPANLTPSCNHQTVVSSNSAQNTISLGRSMMPSSDNNDFIKDDIAKNTYNHCNNFLTQKENVLLAHSSPTNEMKTFNNNMIGNEITKPTLICSATYQKNSGSSNLDESEKNVVSTSVVASHYPFVSQENGGGLLASPSQITMAAAANSFSQEELDLFLKTYLSNSVMQQTQNIGASSSLFYPNSVVERSPMVAVFPLSSPRLPLSPRENLFGRTDTPLIASSSATSSSPCEAHAGAPGPFATSGTGLIMSPYFYRNDSIAAKHQNEDFSRLNSSGMPSSPPFPSLVMSPQLHNRFVTGTPTTLQNFNIWNYATMQQASQADLAMPTAAISAFSPSECHWIPSQINDENLF